MSMIVLMAAAQVGAAATTKEIELAEIEKAQAAGDAMMLVDRVMPSDIRARIVAGYVRREWLPGKVYWIGYREQTRAVGADMCERAGHSVQASYPEMPGVTASPTKPIIGPVQSWMEMAVLPPGQVASDTICRDAEGYINADGAGDWRIAAYRVLVAAMAAARSSATLPFRIECTAEKPAACADPRRALADMPIGALFAVRVSCLDSDRIIDGSTQGVRMISCPPIDKGAPYQAEIAFGNSGADGQSWRINFTHRTGWPDRMKIRRSTVIYH